MNDSKQLKLTKSEIIFHEGDSVKVLEKLKQSFHCIYLDPPFGTGRKFEFSAHKDKRGFDDTWKEGEYEQWLEEIISKLKKVLHKEGTLFFHISAEQSFVPEKVLSNHFKKIEKIIWKKAHGKNTVKKKLGAVVDVIFMCSDGSSKFNLQYVPLDEYYFENSYTNKDSRGLYALGSIKHDKTRKGNMWTYEKDGIEYVAEYGWKLKYEKFQELLEDDRIHFTKPKKDSNRAMLYKKLYKHESKGKPLSNLWDDISYITRTSQDKRLYPTQKPVKLLERIIAIASDEGDWVLDPVAGSGTTGEAAQNLNRNAVLIDINPESKKIIKNRLGI